MGPLTILMLAWLSPSAQTKQPASPLLLHVAQCLSAKQFLPPAPSTGLTLGYVLDEKSYPGDRVVVVVSYATPTSLNGVVFTAFLTERAAVQTFDIQNNASFVLSKKGPSGVEFLNPPLGGVWTEQHLIAAIKRIERQPRFTIPAVSIAAPEPSIICRAYTDPQPKRSSR